MSVVSLKKILKKLTNKEYRDAYAVEHVQTSLPFQIRALREQREWTQARLASEAATTQTAISRIEDPEYGKLSLNTLYKLASAFDVALLVKFVPFSRLLDEFKDVSVEALAAEKFTDELPKLEGMAAAGNTSTAVTTIKPRTFDIDIIPALTVDWDISSGKSVKDVVDTLVMSSRLRQLVEPVIPKADLGDEITGVRGAAFPVEHTRGALLASMPELDHTANVPS